MGFASSLQLSPAPVEKELPDSSAQSPPAPVDPVLTRFDEKASSVKQDLGAVLTYLDSLKAEPPSIQRLSALNADVQLDWRMLQQKITIQEQALPSYRLMEETVGAFQSLIAYWRESQKKPSEWSRNGQSHANR